MRTMGSYAASSVGIFYLCRKLRVQYSLLGHSKLRVWAHIISLLNPVIVRKVLFLTFEQVSFFH
ncbi:hypothetical protein LguiA_013635 [Lonicera macranthoides]